MENSSLPMRKASDQWWGSLNIPQEKWCFWEISLLKFYVFKALNEWHFAWIREGDPLDTTLRSDFSGTQLPDLENTEQSRYVFTHTKGGFNLGLALADRSIVARPDVSVSIPPGHKVILYMSSGIWLQPNVDGLVLLDLPIYRPSDTWFGPNTRTGELCYFSLTRARTSATESLVYPHRAITPITIINDGSELLKIDRIRVPMQYLSLHLNKRGEFVTDSVIFRLGPDADEARLEFTDEENKSTRFTQIATPREERSDGLLTQTLARLFG